MKQLILAAVLFGTGFGISFTGGARTTSAAPAEEDVDMDITRNCTDCVGFRCQRVSDGFTQCHSTWPSFCEAGGNFCTSGST